jgi:hypothetical protein
VACDKTESGILNSFDFKDRKGVLYSLFAIGAAGSDAANKVATSEALRRSFSGRNKLECLSIEIGLEQAPFVDFVYFFPHLNMQKTC